ncbi:MAG: hypothetical protein Tsb0021_12310 [Chlamydiales bacterium]
MGISNFNSAFKISSLDPSVDEFGKIKFKDGSLYKFIVVKDGKSREIHDRKNAEQALSIVKSVFAETEYSFSQQNQIEIAHGVISADGKNIRKVPSWNNGTYSKKIENLFHAVVKVGLPLMSALEKNKNEEKNVISPTILSLKQVPTFKSEPVKVVEEIKKNEASKVVSIPKWEQRPPSHEAYAPYQVTLEWTSLPKEDDFYSFYDLNDSLIHLQRKLEQLYLDLPWPPSLQRATFVTETPGGRGDASAAAKLIGVLHREVPELKFDWVPLKSTGVDFKQFLNDDQSKVVNLERNKVQNSQLLIVGPAQCVYKTPAIARNLKVEFGGPRFSFLEAGYEPMIPEDDIKKCIRKVNEQSEDQPIESVLVDVFTRFFSTKCDSNGIDGIQMGLLEGSGIFFDQSRIDAHLSRGHYCPKPLLGLQDDSLRQDIFESMGVANSEDLPDFDRYSMNSGYAHYPVSWGRLIDSVALHEQKKHVVIVLNQHGEFKDDRLNTQEFCSKMFTPERLELLKQEGYHTVQVKGKGEQHTILEERSDEEGRQFTVIVRPSFHPNDMKQLQLASQRILATGMNSPAEAWASRCELFLYEDVNNGGRTGDFLKQQVKVAESVHPKLARFMAIMGDKDKKYHEKNVVLSHKEMEEVRELLKDPEISVATLKFCEHVQKNYRFEKALLASLKRVYWHHLIPDLKKVEVETMDPEFKEALFHHLKTLSNEKKVFKIQNFYPMAQAIHQRVFEYLTEQKNISIVP